MNRTFISASLICKFINTSPFFIIDDQNDSKSEAFLRMNQTSLLENLEPIVMLEKSGIKSLFNTEEINKMKKIESRKERAKFFLDKCHKLSREEKDWIVTHLKETLPSSEELPSPMELGV